MKHNTSLKKRIIPLLIILPLIIATFASVMFGKYVKRAEEVNNIFTPAKPITPSVVEDEFDGIEKTNVKINVGKTEYPVYVRAAIVVTWKDKDGIVYYKLPLTDPDGSDYTIDLNLFESGKKNSWVLADDGYYYYVDSKGNLQAVETEQPTENLINSCKQINFETAPNGYSLSVEIIAQTVQVFGTTDDLPPKEKPAYQDAWGEAAP